MVKDHQKITSAEKGTNKILSKFHRERERERERERASEANPPLIRCCLGVWVMSELDTWYFGFDDSSLLLLWLEFRVWSWNWGWVGTRFIGFEVEVGTGFIVFDWIQTLTFVLSKSNVFTRFLKLLSTFLYKVGRYSNAARKFVPLVKR